MQPTLFIQAKKNTQDSNTLWDQGVPPWGGAQEWTLPTPMAPKALALGLEPPLN